MVSKSDKLIIVFPQKDYGKTFELPFDSSTVVRDISKRLEKELSIPSNQTCVLKSTNNESSLPLIENNCIVNILPSNHRLFGFILDYEEEYKVETSSIRLHLKFGHRLYEAKFSIDSQIQFVIHDTCTRLNLGTDLTVELYRKNSTAPLEGTSTIKELGLKDQDLIIVKKVPLLLIQQRESIKIKLLQSISELPRESLDQQENKKIIKLNFKRLQAVFYRPVEDKETFHKLRDIMGCFKTDYFITTDSVEILNEHACYLSDFDEVIIANRTLDLEEELKRAENELEKKDVILKISRLKTCDVLEKLARSIQMEAEEMNTLKEILNIQLEYHDKIASGKVEEKKAQNEQVQRNAEAWGVYYAKKFFKGIIVASGKAGPVAPFASKILTEPAIFKALDALRNTYNIANIASTSSMTSAIKFWSCSCVAIVGANVGFALLESSYYLIQFCRSKISGKQFLKHIAKIAGRSIGSTAVSMGGAIAGASVGLAITAGNPMGAFIGGLVGTILGSLIGGYIGELICEKVYNYIQSKQDEKARETLLKNSRNLLGITEKSTWDEVVKSWKKLVLHYHPDKHCSEDKAEKERMTAKFTEVHTAFCILREEYQKKLGVDRTKEAMDAIMIMQNDPFDFSGF